jgi:hypothetical protein
MKRLLLATALLAAGTLAAAAQPIGGTYNVEGTNLNGSPYSGTAQINVLSETTCEIIWVTGGTESAGLCMRNGPAFAAFYVMDSGTFGLVIYEVFDNGVMNGLWTITGQPGVGTEILTPQ